MCIAIHKIRCNTLHTSFRWMASVEDWPNFEIHRKEKSVRKFSNHIHFTLIRFFRCSSFLLWCQFTSMYHWMWLCGHNPCVNGFGSVRFGSPKCAVYLKWLWRLLAKQWNAVVERAAMITRTHHPHTPNISIRQSSALGFAHSNNFIHRWIHFRL